MVYFHINQIIGEDDEVNEVNGFSKDAIMDKKHKKIYKMILEHCKMMLMEIADTL